MRPTSIVAFELIFLLGTLMSLPGLYRRSLGESALYGWVGVVVVALLLGLTFAVSRRRSRVAKWALVGFFAFGLLLSARSGFAGFGGYDIAETLLSGFALALLFTRSARGWMAGEAPVVGRR